MPAAHNAPGFTSFADYLAANAGSLAQERAGALGDVTQAQGTSAADLERLKGAAYGAGSQAAQGVSYGANEPFPEVPGFNATELPEYAAFTSDQQKAEQAAQGLTGPRVSDKYGVRESSMIGGDVGYQQAAEGLQKGGALDDYLSGRGGLQDKFKEGYLHGVTRIEQPPAAPAGTPEKAAEAPVGTGYNEAGGTTGATAPTGPGQPGESRTSSSGQTYYYWPGSTDEQGNPTPGSWRQSDPNAGPETGAGGG